MHTFKRSERIDPHCASRNRNPNSGIRNLSLPQKQGC